MQLLSNSVVVKAVLRIPSSLLQYIVPYIRYQAYGNDIYSAHAMTFGLSRCMTYTVVYSFDEGVSQAVLLMLPVTAETQP